MFSELEAALEGSGRGCGVFCLCCGQAHAGDKLAFAHHVSVMDCPSMSFPKVWLGVAGVWMGLQLTMLVAAMIFWISAGCVRVSVPLLCRTNLIPRKDSSVSSMVNGESESKSLHLGEECVSLLWVPEC